MTNGPDPMVTGAKVVRGLIIGLATTFLLGLLGGLASMWPDLDLIPHMLSVLFPEVCCGLREVPPRFLHQVFFRSLVAATIIMAAFTGRCLVAVSREMRRRHGNL